MAYSNVTPPTLPAEYDSTAYPHYVLVFNYGLSDEDWYQVHLYYSAMPFNYDGSAVTNAAAVFTQIYGTDSSAWTTAEQVTPSLSPGKNGNVYQRIYTNHDITDTSGKVWLAADSVTLVRVTEQWLRSFWDGVSMGLCGKAIFSKKEPVAYLYNGVRLPGLPEWDKTAYPYAVMLNYPGEPHRHESVLLFSSVPMTFELGWYNTLYATDSGSMIYYARSNQEPVTDWTRNESKDSTFFSGDVVYQSGAYSPFWANFDIYRTDGTLHTEASEPVPVYE